MFTNVESKMSSYHSIAVLTVILLITQIINISAVNSEFITRKNDSSVAHFNSLYVTSFDERVLRAGKQCRGDCTKIFYKSFNSYYPRRYEGCLGKLHACDPIFDGIKVQCQLCMCLCERTFNPIVDTYRGELLDSFCLDPVAVDPGYVATGVRFKKHENRIHIELQQGKFQFGKIIEETISWKSTNGCKKSQKVIKNFHDWEHEGFKVMLEDIILPTKAVVTGVTFTELLRGKYLDQNKNVDEQRPEIYKKAQCGDSDSEMEDHYNLNQLMDDGTWNSSVPCNNYVSFKGSPLMEDYMQHVVPFIDLHEIVTDPPRPIRGIGWYLKTDGVLQEQLSLRIL